MKFVKVIPCRVCQNHSKQVFEKFLYWGELIPYFACEVCGHLQTSPPTWLPQAYQTAYGQEDVGMADRCFWSAHTAVAFAYRTNIGPKESCLDWGTGSGLFVRFSRNAGLNCYGYEPLGDPAFARPFICQQENLLRPWSLITAFEVVEHFANPTEEFGRIFKLCPDAILLSTLLYKDQGPDWWYLVGNGQHVAIYTEASLRHLGQQHGYHFVSDGTELHLFSKKKHSSSLLQKIRKKREVLTQKYRKRHGSLVEADSQFIRHNLRKGVSSSP